MSRCANAVRHRVPPAFHPAHPRRPRFGMSDRRPSRFAPPRSCPRNVRSRLSSPGAAPSIPRGSEESRPRPPSTLFRPFGCGSIASGLTTAIEVAIGAAREIKGIRQWLPSAPSPRRATAFPEPSKPWPSTSRPSWSASRTPPRRPRTSASSRRIGFGPPGRRSPTTGRDYLSVKLDDPSFPAPIYATLIEVDGEEGLQLIWSRPSRD